MTIAKILSVRFESSYSRMRLHLAIGYTSEAISLAEENQKQPSTGEAEV